MQWDSNIEIRLFLCPTWGTLGVLSCSGIFSMLTVFSMLAPLDWVLMPGRAMDRICLAPDLLPAALLLVLLEMLILSASRVHTPDKYIIMKAFKKNIKVSSPLSADTAFWSCCCCCWCCCWPRTVISMPRNFAKFFLPCLGWRRRPFLLLCSF